MPGRMLWLTTGLMALACGLAGIVLPLVPTTPFLLVAAFSFARSSPRLHDWLVTHPRLGPPIHDWNTHGAIRQRAKATAIVLMAATLVLSLAAGVSNVVLTIQAVVLIIVAAFVLTRPHGPEEGV